MPIYLQDDPPQPRDFQPPPTGPNDFIKPPDPAPEDSWLTKLKEYFFGSDKPRDLYDTTETRMPGFARDVIEPVMDRTVPVAEKVHQYATIAPLRKAAGKFADWITTPGGEMQPDPMVPASMVPAERKMIARGFLGGAAQGAAEQITPVNVALAVTPYAAGKAAMIAPELASAIYTGDRLLNAGIAAEGAASTVDAVRKSDDQMLAEAVAQREQEIGRPLSPDEYRAIGEQLPMQRLKNVASGIVPAAAGTAFAFRTRPTAPANQAAADRALYMQRTNIPPKPEGWTPKSRLAGEQWRDPLWQGPKPPDAAAQTPAQAPTTSPVQAPAAAAAPGAPPPAAPTAAGPRPPAPLVHDSPTMPAGPGGPAQLTLHEVAEVSPEPSPDALLRVATELAGNGDEAARWMQDPERVQEIRTFIDEHPTDPAVAKHWRQGDAQLPPLPPGFDELNQIAFGGEDRPLTPADLESIFAPLRKQQEQAPAPDGMVRLPDGRLVNQGIVDTFNREAQQQAGQPAASVSPTPVEAPNAPTTPAAQANPTPAAQTPAGPSAPPAQIRLGQQVIHNGRQGRVVAFVRGRARVILDDGHEIIVPRAELQGVGQPAIPPAAQPTPAAPPAPTPADVAAQTPAQPEVTSPVTPVVQETPPEAAQGELPTAPPVQQVNVAESATANGYPVDTAVVSAMPTTEINVDPQRFQYKIGADKEGVTQAERIRDEKWDPNAGGQLLVWRDPADGKVYVVNGHHRLAFAKSVGQQHVLVRFIDAENAQQARALGALNNIREGRGTSVDAAKMIRDSGWSEQELASRGMKFNTKVGQEGIALANLSDPTFNAVATGQMPVSRGVAIGKAGLTEAEEGALMRLLEKREKRGRALSNEVVAELAKEVANARTVDVAGQGTQGNFFDDVLGDEHLLNTAVEKATLRAWARETFARDRRLFGFVTRKGRAERLGEAGETVIDETAAKARAEEAAQQEQVFDQLVDYSGPINDALNEAAARLARGDAEAIVRQELLARIREGVEAELANPTPRPTPVRPQTPVPGSELGQSVPRSSGPGENAGVSTEAGKPEGPQLDLTAPTEIENALELTPPDEAGPTRAELEAAGQGSLDDLLGSEPTKAELEAEGQRPLHLEPQSRFRPVAQPYPNLENFLAGPFGNGQFGLEPAIASASRASEIYPEYFQDWDPAWDRPVADNIADLARVLNRENAPLHSPEQLAKIIADQEARIAAAERTIQERPYSEEAAKARADLPGLRGGLDELRAKAGVKRPEAPTKADEPASGDLFGDEPTDTRPTDSSTSSDATDLEDIVGQGDEPPAPTIPANVRSFLRKQLKYTDEQINAMDPEQAAQIGRDRVMNPNIPQDYTPRRKPSEGPIPDEARELSELLEGSRTGEMPDEPLPGFAASQINKVQRIGQRMARFYRMMRNGEMPRFSDEQLQAAAELQDAITSGEFAADVHQKAQSVGAAAAEERVRPAKNAQTLARAAREMYPEDQTAYERVTNEQAQRRAEQSFVTPAAKGEKFEIRKDPETGEVLYSFADPIITPHIKALHKLYKENPAHFWALIRATGTLSGAVIGGEEAHRQGKELITGMLIGAAVGGALTSGKAYSARTYIGMAKWAARLVAGGEKTAGVAPVRAARDPNKDIGWLELIRGTPERTVPDIFEKANQTITRLQTVFGQQQGRSLASLQATEKLYMGAVVKEIQAAAKDARAKGLTKRALYAEALARRLGNRLTSGQKVVRQIGQAITKNDKFRGDWLEREVSANAYRILTGFALDTAAQNLTQPILALAHVPAGDLAWAYKHVHDAEFAPIVERLKLKRPMDFAGEDVLGRVLGDKKPDPEWEFSWKGLAKHPLKTLNEIRKDPQFALRGTDTYNRQVVYLGARRYAMRRGMAEPQADAWAQSVMRKTQGHPGPLGDNPFMAGPVMGSLKPFTKFPTMFIEHMVDTLNQPDYAGRRRLILTMMGLSLAGAKAGIDVEDLLISGGRPLGLDPFHMGRSLSRFGSLRNSPFPVLRGAGAAISALPGSGDIVPAWQTLAEAGVGRFPMKVATTAGRFAQYGWDNHPMRSASGSEDAVTPWEDLLNLLGPKTTRQTRIRDVMKDAADDAALQKATKSEATQEQRMRYLDALDRGDARAASQALAGMSPAAARELIRGAHRSRWEKLLRNAPRDIRRNLQQKYGQEMEELQVRPTAR